MGTAVNGTDAHHLDNIGVHLLSLLTVLPPDACGVSITHAPGMGRSAHFMVHDDRRAPREMHWPRSHTHAVSHTWYRRSKTPAPRHRG